MTRHTPKTKTRISVTVVLTVEHEAGKLGELDQEDLLDALHEAVEGPTSVYEKGLVDRLASSPNALALEDKIWGVKIDGIAATRNRG
jgi:hypothetical protein